MLGSMALVRTHVSEEHSASIIRVTRIGRIGELATTLAVTTNSVDEDATFYRNVCSYKTHTA
jgi:hypothetical protein